MFLFIREMNEPVMVNQAKLFPSYYTNRVVHLFTSKYRSYVLKLIYIFGHVLTVNNRCYVTKNLYHSVLSLNLIINTCLEVNSARLIQNTFYKCPRALNFIFLKNCISELFFCKKKI